MGDPASATWESGTLTGDAPGPTTYWIDAVVELEPATADALRELSLSATDSTPDVVESVTESIPPGQLLSGTELDQEFAEGSFRAKAFLVGGPTPLCSRLWVKAERRRLQRYRDWVFTMN